MKNHHVPTFFVVLKYKRRDKNKKSKRNEYGQRKKLEIENERLKKGYQVKGVGANKEFIILKDVNMK